jgi:hypothetical protein
MHPQSATRGALVVALLASAGCGGGSPDPSGGRRDCPLTEDEVEGILHAAVTPVKKTGDVICGYSARTASGVRVAPEVLVGKKRQTLEQARAPYDPPGPANGTDPDVELTERDDLGGFLLTNPA